MSAFDPSTDPVSRDSSDSGVPETNDKAAGGSKAPDFGFLNDLDPPAGGSEGTAPAEIAATTGSATEARPNGDLESLTHAIEKAEAAAETEGMIAPEEVAAETAAEGVADGAATIAAVDEAIAATSEFAHSDVTAAPEAAEEPSAVAEEPVAEAPPLVVPTIEEEPLPPPPDANDPTYPAYEQLVGHVRQTSLLGSIEAVLGWDERCMMPAAGAEQRAEQITLLSGIIHERLTDPRLGDLLNELAAGNLAADPLGESGATIRQIKRQFEKRSKLPKSLVEELAHTAVMGQHTWQEARKNNDFASFAPLLEKMVHLKRQQAEALGYAETPYDALLDEFEQGELTSRVTAVLGALRDELVPLVAQVRDGGRSPDIDVIHRKFPVEDQRAFGRYAAERIGFDFRRGRLDVTAHPFCTGLGPNDCRITTRYDAEHFNSGFFGILHEAGHGIYDQGLRAEQYGLPLGEAVSMGIHESQSRMWEILVGRSLPFWKHFYPQARRTFRAALGDVTLGRFYFAINDVRPSLIRVEADEFTYNLHILIRFELEQALISGDLQVADLPAAWNQKYRDYLGIEVPNDADGVLQDIHWSAGLFGYFPTYSLGNLYASQLFEQADKELGGLAAQFERGEFQHLRKWLNVKIHRHGQRYTAAELCERITGRPLSHEPLMAHLRGKYELLYAPEAESIETLDVPDAPAAGAAGFEFGGGVAMEETTDVVSGYGLANEPALGGFGGESVGAAIGARPLVIRKRPQASPFAAIIVMGGIVAGGVLGIALGLWILLWWKGPQGDVLKIRDKLPEWIVPAWKEPEPEIPIDPNAAPAEGETPPDGQAGRSPRQEVERSFARRVIVAAGKRIV